MATIANPLGGLFSTPSAPTSIIASSIPDTGGDGGDASGWLSGLGDLFAGAGTAISSIIRAENIPSVPSAGSGWIFNPVTNSYHNAAGQQLTATGSVPSQPGFSSLGGNSLMFLLIAIVGFFLLRKKV